jgi:hypothetical protein
VPGGGLGLVLAIADHLAFGGAISYASTRIASKSKLWMNFAELLIDCEEDRTLRTVGVRRCLGETAMASDNSDFSEVPADPDRGSAATLPTGAILA